MVQCGHTVPKEGTMQTRFGDVNVHCGNMPDTIYGTSLFKGNPKRDQSFHIVQELCESRGGRPGLSVLTSLLASVDVKLY